MQGKGKDFSPKELEGTPVRMLGDALITGKEVERRRRELGIGFLFETNTHNTQHMHACFSMFQEQRRKEREEEMLTFTGGKRGR